MIDTIIFDGEGVVIDTEAIWDIGQAEFLKRRGLVYEREKIKPLLTGRTVQEGVEILMREYGFTGDPDTLAIERMDIVRDLFVTQVDFIDGFREFYDHVRGTYKTAVATAMAKDLLEIVNKQLGLEDLFGEKIFSVDGIGCRSKPHPDLFLFVADKLGSQVENCIVIEDAPHGIEAARRAGMMSVGLMTTYSSEKLDGADLIVDSFSEIELPI